MVCGIPHPQLRNQLHLAECTCRKSGMWAAMCYAGLASKGMLNVRLKCKACHAEERAAFHPTPTTPLCPAAPQNQLHLAECSCRKSCMVSCDVSSTIRSTTPLPQLRKSIAPCRMQPPKKLHGGLRCDMRGWRPKS